MKKVTPHRNIPRVVRKMSKYDEVLIVTIDKVIIY